MSTSAAPSRESWRQDLAPYLEVDRRRSLAQIASSVLPYLAVWAAVIVLIQPSAPLAIALGLVATVFMSRMYSLFHDLTHNSLFSSRRENSRWGHVLGYFLFTPYRWWQRQHAIHHAHSGDLEHRGVGEINTMTVEEYESASRLAARVPALPQPDPAAGHRAQPRVSLRPALPPEGDEQADPVERRGDEPGAGRLGVRPDLARRLADATCWSRARPSSPAEAIGAWLLYIQHQYEDTYFQSSRDWSFELAALQGSSYLKLPRPLAWMVCSVNFHHVHHLSAKIPNYNLRAAHENHPMFRNTPVVTFRSGMQAFRLKLWDTESESLVPFPTRRADSISSSMRRPRGRRGAPASGGLGWRAWP